MELNSELDRLQKELESYRPIMKALKKAEEKHPKWHLNMYKQCTILNEEAGEVNKAVLHLHDEGGEYCER